ncbi:MAG: hypothetical protein EOP46_19185 [Sphingobacteriaceae bacterium]|nr:MAG: hypothetical protein EOP46_19185 [Sphingobacteriaceae bacterium]
MTAWITAHIIDKEDFKWTSSFNLTTLKNRVTALANNADIYSANGIGVVQSVTRVGYAVGSIFTVKTTGVNPENGQRIFINRFGREVQYNQASATSRWTYLDGTAAPAIDGVLDGQVSGSGIAPVFGGFNNSLSYKAFDLNIGITYSSGNKIYNGTKATLADQRYFNNRVDILDRWTTPGQVTDIPKVVYGDSYSAGFAVSHSGNVEDGSFVRLKNVLLGYRLPKQLVNSIGIASVRIYAQASNLYTITSYTGSDPEISMNGNSNLGTGTEQNSVPGARSYTFGLNIGF